MDYRFLGKSGLKVSELAMGTQTFGWGAQRNVAHAIADRFVGAGGNMFDTSSTYNNGESESILGECLETHGRRDSLVIASKAYFPTGDGANDSDTVEEGLRIEIGRFRRAGRRASSLRPESSSAFPAPAR